jgi:dihydropteroate synthase
LQAVSHHTWLVAKGRAVRCGERPLIMGVVNVTDDSFYDGGRYVQPERAVAHAVELAEQGADILDIGAESTRPGAHPVSEEDELARVVPVIAELARRVGLPISVDTTKSRVAQSGAGVVLMHMQGTPQTMQAAPAYGYVVAEVMRFFHERMQAALEAGIPQMHIVLDPGIGFGKLLEHNLTLLNRLPELAMLDRPLLVGVSRKAFIGQLVGRSPEQREWGTAAAVALAVDRGARILRVHDVAMMADVVKVAAAIRTGAPSPSQVRDA